ncbi:MAG: acetate--CoA ligase [Thaumarchaeota archaeon]|nr:acetate--CoA ligase [Candidatus Calditenuaceae archaeon]MDW8186446.1 acetate--CoA ligase [Nitrososphaerota archaeon]
MSYESFQSEPLPFEERLVLKNWENRTVDPQAYQKFHDLTTRDFERFWEGVANELEWFKKWDHVLLPGEHPNVYRWFVGSLQNISYLCLDRHVKTWRRNKVAIIWEGEPLEEGGSPKEVRKLTYYDLWRLTNRIASGLTRIGVRRGERVAIYMPMIPELPAVLYACARIGATFTVVFSGFTSENLAMRMRDLGARFLVTADGFYRRGKAVRLKEVADSACQLYDGIEKVVVVRRLRDEVPMKEGRDVFMDDLLSQVPVNAYVEPERMTIDEPLYVLYTSGTTGKPKGIIHDHHGYSVILHATMKWIFDIRDDDVYYCTADIGWVTGHSYVAFGPLMEGATIVMYEGAPDFPGPDRWWSIVERYGVTILYTTPTAVRMLMRFGEEPVRKHDLSSLRLIHSVGEPINPSAWRWLFEVVGGKRCPVGSTWWQTETGGILISHAPGLMLVPLKPGTNGPPLPGVEVEVVDENGNPLPPGAKGLLVIKKPWPGMLGPPTGMWGDPAGYNRVYWSRFPGIYYTGDYAIKDQDGYIWVAGRADEVLKVAGHRLGTFELESALVSNPAVAEAAVVGLPDPIKGEVPLAFVTLKVGHMPSEKVKAQLMEWLRERYGPIAVPKDVLFVKGLPKTRSGKIMRRLLRAVVMGAPLGDVTTLEDEATVDEVKTAYEELKDYLKT